MFENNITKKDRRFANGLQFKGGGKSAKRVSIPDPPPIEEKQTDVQVSAKKKKEKDQGSTRSSGLNRFLIVPGSSGSGPNVPE